MLEKNILFRKNCFFVHNILIWGGILVRRSEVAVITRTKNRPIMLERAIKSVCSQSFQDWILVIVNDGGAKNEVNQLVQKYSTLLKERIEVIHNEASLGMEAASNIGIKSVNSEYILIHDDDDTIHESFLEKTVGFFKNSIGAKFSGVATKVKKVIEEIKSDEIIFKKQESWNSELQTITLAEMAISNKIVPISFLYKREVHEEVGYYNEELPVLGDWEFYLRFLRCFDIYVFQEELANYHHRLVTEGIYSNTIIGQSDKHKLFDSLIRNNLLRKDFSSDKIGIGHIVNYAKIISDQDNKVKKIENAHNSILRQLKFNKIEDVAIYGTGAFSKDLASILKFNNINISVFVDSNEELWGTTFINVPVISIKDAVNKGYSSFIIGSFSFMDEIAETIQKEFIGKDTKYHVYCG
jgi:glycosyltransferase involved in cell wall biosynthesis